MNADEIKAIKLALWALEEQRKKLISDTKSGGKDILINCRLLVEIVEVMDIFRKWISCNGNK